MMHATVQIHSVHFTCSLWEKNNLFNQDCIAHCVHVLNDTGPNDCLCPMFVESQKKEEKKEGEGQGTGWQRRNKRWRPGVEWIRRFCWRRSSKAGSSQHARLWLYRAASQRESLQDMQETRRACPDSWAVCFWKHHRQWTVPQVWAESWRKFDWLSTDFDWHSPLKK